MLRSETDRKVGNLSVHPMENIFQETSGFFEIDSDGVKWYGDEIVLL
jgi:hypothetical protein